MDPWRTESSTSNENLSHDSFEDNFKPSVSESLPDSQQYLQILENKLQKLKNDPDILRQLSEKREACMQQLLAGTDFDQDNSELEAPVNASAILRAIAPERQALTSGEIVELVKLGLSYVMLQEGLLFLMNLAWESRLRLPLLLTCAFMALNVRMQLEINVYTQNNGRNRLIEVIQEAVETVDSDSDDSDTQSWQTTDEWDAQSHTSDDTELAV
ncbi:uncharacterized protein CBL_09036 [Carabus blaptoides fortunei]